MTVTAAEPPEERPASTSAYTTGGELPTGWTSSVNTTGHAEPVLTAAQVDEHTGGAS